MPPNRRAQGPGFVSPMLQLSDAAVDYGGEPVVRDLTVHLNKGEFSCLLGPSGCGKTTTLRAIAGFEPLSGGEIRIAGVKVSEPGATLAPERRRVTRPSGACDAAVIGR